MPRHSRFIAFPLLLLFALFAFLAPLRADGEAPQLPQVAMAGASTANDPPLPPNSWAGLQEAIAARTWYQAVAEQNALKQRARHTHGHASTGSGHSGESTAACIARVENHGDYGRSSNPTHFGRYQYSLSTWIKHGGKEEDWGHASPEEQDRVFAEGTAKYGYGDWTPYDPC